MTIAEHSGFQNMLFIFCEVSITRFRKILRSIDLSIAIQRNTRKNVADFFQLRKISLILRQNLTRKIIIFCKDREIVL